MSDPERILIVRLSHLGDVVSALGVFHALHAAYPAAEIAWTVQPEFAELLEGLPGLKRIVPFGRREGWRAWPRLRRELRRFRPDLVVDAQANLKSAGVSMCSGAPRKAGLARKDWREPLGAMVLNDPAPPCAPEERHAIQRMQRLARHVAPGVELPLRSDPALSAEEIRRGEGALAGFSDLGEGALALHLSSPEDVRSWPAESWSGLIRSLRAAGTPCLVISGTAEAELGRRLAREVPADARLRHWVDQRGLRELAAFFHAASRRAWRLVACDSGPMHLAWACGLPVVLLAGPQDAARTGPWPPGPDGPHRVVRSAAPPSCAPCLARRCHHPEGPICMSTITADDVLAAL